MSEETKRFSLSFIVPALNEGEAVAGTVREIVPVGERYCERFEVVLVDDGSTDDTGVVMDRLVAADRRIRVVHNPTNIGFGGSFKRGVAAASCDFVMVVPGDDSFPAASLAGIVERIGEADLVIPFPANPEVRNLHRRIFSAAFTMIVNLLFGLKIPYYNSLVVYRRSHYGEIQGRIDGFVYQAEGIVRMIDAGRSYVTTPTTIRDQAHTRSTAFRPVSIVNAIIDIGRLCWDLRVGRRRPRA